MKDKTITFQTLKSKAFFYQPLLKWAGGINEASQNSVV
jgi:hypothetical protein